MRNILDLFRKQAPLYIFVKNTMASLDPIWVPTKVLMKQNVGDFINIMSAEGIPYVTEILKIQKAFADDGKTLKSVHMEVQVSGKPR